MHNYISCPNYMYLQSFTKLGSVVSEQLCLQKCDRWTGKNNVTLTNLGFVRGEDKTALQLVIEKDGASVKGRTLFYLYFFLSVLSQY